MRTSAAPAKMPSGSPERPDRRQPAREDPANSFRDAEKKKLSAPTSIKVRSRQRPHAVVGSVADPARPEQTPRGVVFATLRYMSAGASTGRVAAQKARRSAGEHRFPHPGIHQLLSPAQRHDAVGNPGCLSHSQPPFTWISGRSGDHAHPAAHRIAATAARRDVHRPASDAVFAAGRHGLHAARIACSSLCASVARSCSPWGAGGRGVFRVPSRIVARSQPGFRRPARPRAIVVSGRREFRLSRWARCWRPSSSSPRASSIAWFALAALCRHRAARPPSAPGTTAGHGHAAKHAGRRAPSPFHPPSSPPRSPCWWG